MGSVTSNAISTWSPFTLGSLGSVLPVRWLSFTGQLNAQSQATLRWRVAEQNTTNYEVQKNENGRNFQAIATLGGKGNGTHNYSFMEAGSLRSSVYYRIMQREGNGSFSYFTVLLLKGDDAAGSINLYPNPVASSTILSVPPKLVGTGVLLRDGSGRVVRSFRIQAATQSLDLTDLVAGTYLLQVDGELNIKIIKN